MIDPNIILTGVNVIVALLLTLLAVYIRKYSKYLDFAVAVLVNAAFIVNDLAELIREIDMAAADGRIDRDEADRIMKKLLKIIRELEKMSKNKIFSVFYAIIKSLKSIVGGFVSLYLSISSLIAVLMASLLFGKICSRTSLSSSAIC